MAEVLRRPDRVAEPCDSGAALPPRLRAKLICRSQNRVLLLRNTDGSWDLPGGKVEPGEAVETALAREFEEEVGLALPAIRFFGAWQRERRRGPVHVHFYEALADLRSATIRLSSEHMDACWAGASQISAFAMPDGYRGAALALLARA